MIMVEKPKAPKYPEANIETYIGDGVYVSHDNYNLWLRTDRYDGDDVVLSRIALEPEVFQALIKYAKLFGGHFIEGREGS